MMSAPMPRVRRCDSSSRPSETPTIIMIIITSTAMARIVNAVRTLRWARLRNTRRLIIACLRSHFGGGFAEALHLDILRKGQDKRSVGHGLV